MSYLKILILLLFLQLGLYAQALSIENISSNIQNSLHTHLKGQNKAIVQNLYAQTGNKPLWIGIQN